MNLVNIKKISLCGMLSVMSCLPKERQGNRNIGNAIPFRSPSRVLEVRLEEKKPSFMRVSEKNNDSTANIKDKNNENDVKSIDEKETVEKNNEAITLDTNSLKEIKPIEDKKEKERKEEEKEGENETQSTDVDRRDIGTKESGKQPEVEDSLSDSGRSSSSDTIPSTSGKRRRSHSQRHGNKSPFKGKR